MSEKTKTLNYAFALGLLAGFGVGVLFATYILPTSKTEVLVSDKLNKCVEQGGTYSLSKGSGRDYEFCKIEKDLPL